MRAHIVVGILRDQEERFFIARRPHHQLGGGQWEFPGGKRESGESVFIALKRELAEELGIEVLAAEPLLQTENDFYSRRVLLDVWHITEYRNEPRGMEGQKICWVGVEEFTDFDFLDGNEPLLQAAFKLKKFSRRK